MPTRATTTWNIGSAGTTASTTGSRPAAYRSVMSQGKIVYWFGTCTDIEDVKRLEAALREADRRKNEFLATLAHELRNPLAPTRTGLQILRLTDERAAHASRPAR